VVKKGTRNPMEKCFPVHPSSIPPYGVMVAVGLGFRVSLKKKLGLTS
jgi:hypothetical protein